jgi:hypothetical protein
LCSFQNCVLRSEYIQNRTFTVACGQTVVLSDVDTWQGEQSDSKEHGHLVPQEGQRRWNTIWVNGSGNCRSTEVHIPSETQAFCFPRGAVFSRILTVPDWATPPLPLRSVADSKWPHSAHSSEALFSHSTTR